ncbi:hypothetical protein KC367_g210 [Hortaea werneckii]|nr:hypothetical protein KC367_g210 [Hortaea werneckii]
MFLNVTERLSVPGNVLPFCKVWSSSKSMSVPSLSSSCSVATFVFSCLVILAMLSEHDPLVFKRRPFLTSCYLFFRFISRSRPYRQCPNRQTQDISSKRPTP